MEINKPSLVFLLIQIFKVHDDQDLPEITKEGFGFDIENMKGHTRSSGELLELKLMLEYLMKLDFEEVLKFIPSNDHFEEEEDIRALLNLALQSDWSELGETSSYDLNEIKFLEVPSYEWRPKKIRETQMKNGH